MKDHNSCGHGLCCEVPRLRAVERGSPACCCSHQNHQAPEKRRADSSLLGSELTWVCLPDCWSNTGTMKNTFLRAGSRGDVIHPGFGVGTDPEEELRLLLFEVAAQKNRFLPFSTCSLPPALAVQGSSSTLNLYPICPS